MKHIPVFKAFLERFREHILRKRIFSQNNKILIACSGGPDSVVLVHLLNMIAANNSLNLGILHFDHQLRSASKADARFVRAFSKKLKLPFYLGAGNVKQEALRTKASIEEAARKMRYDFFVKTAKRLGIRTVALAHTRDDQAETVLMRILQGTGLRGLSGIREIMNMKGVMFIRPLLQFTKKELLDFGRAAKVAYRRDKSNDSVQFLRNRIRRILLPVLRRDFNPRVVEALSRIPEIVSGESALIAELEAKAWKKAFKRSYGNRIDLRRSVFLKFPQALQFRIIEKALKKLDKQSGLSFEAWGRFRKGLLRPRFCLSLPKDIDFALTPKKATLYKKKLPA